MTETVAAIIIGLLVINLIGLLLVGVRVHGQQDEGRDLDLRLTRLEARVENLPTHGDLNQLGRAITETAENVAAISGQTQTMTQMLRTIQEHMLERERR